MLKVRSNFVWHNKKLLCVLLSLPFLSPAISAQTSSPKQTPKTEAKQERLKVEPGVITSDFDFGDPSGPGFGDTIDHYVAPSAYTYNFNELNNVQTDVPTLTTELMGDRIDPSTGTISWSHTDVSIPGNFAIPVEITRTLQDTGNWTSATRELGNWSLDIPHVRSSYVTNPNGGFGDRFGSLPAWADNKACSAGLNSNPRFVKYIQGQTFRIAKEDYWQGDTIHIPSVGSQKILQDGAVKKTTNHWKISCASVGGVNAFKVTIPNGTTYTFSSLKTVKSLKPVYLSAIDEPCQSSTGCQFPGVSGNPEPDDRLTMQVVHAFMQVSEVKDRFGNTVTYSYNSQGNLTRIFSSDGREIQIVYTGSGEDQRVSYLVANGRTWRYEYMMPSSNSNLIRLSKVTLPDSRKWQFDYPVNQSFHSNYWLSSNIGQNTQLDIYDPLLCATGKRGGFINITHPSGARGEFDLTENCIGTAAVPKLQKYNRYGQGEPFQTYALQINSTQNAIEEKRLFLGDGTTYKWEYLYSSNPGYFFADYPNEAPSYTHYNTSSEALNEFPLDFVQEPLANTNATYIKQPDGSVHLSISESKYGYTNGKQLYYATYSSGGELLAVTKNQYSPSSNYMGSTKQIVHCIPDYTVTPIPSGLALDSQHCFDQSISSSRHVNTTNATITMFDGNAPTVFSKTYSNFNEYDNAQKIREIGPSGTREIFLGFLHNEASWLLNLPTTVKLSVNGGSQVTLSEKTYYPASSSSEKKLQVQHEKYFGTARKTFVTYHTGAGKKGQIKDVDLHLTTSGAKRRVSFDDYHRGQATLIKAPLRYTAGTMSLVKTVDSNGWVTSTTDFNGTTMRYKYTPMGFVSAIDLSNDSQYGHQWQDTLISYNYPSTGGMVRTHRKCQLNALMTACAGSTSLTTTETLDSFYRLIQTAASYEDEDEDEDETRYQTFEYNYNNQQTFSSFVSNNNDEKRGTTTNYDALQRKTSSSTSGMGVTKVEYLHGHKVKTINPREYSTITYFRAFGSPSFKHPTLIQSPEGVTTTLTYDTVANVRTITQSGGGKTQTETRHYDSNNNLCLTTRSDVGNTQIYSNLMGEPMWQAQGATNSCSGKPSYAVDFVLDNLGDVKQVLYPDSTPDLTYTLDPNGNVTRLQSGSVIQEYSYNNLNLIEDEKHFIPGLSAKTVDYRYNNAQHQTGIVYPSQTLVHYHPNAFGEPSHISKAGKDFATGIDFYAHGAIDHFYYGNGVYHKTTLNRDSNLPTNVADTFGATRYAYFDYKYDNNGNITDINDGVDSGYNLTDITYDGLDRLTYITGGSKNGNSSVGYDALGNITRLNTKNRDLYYTYDNSSNRLMSVWSQGSNAKPYGHFDYDSRGNVKHNSHFGMSYNLANQMVAANGNAYLYDGHNRRVKRIESSGTTYSIYSQSGQLLFTKDDTKQTDYIYLGSRLVAEDTSNEGTLYVHTDNLGSPVIRSKGNRAFHGQRKHYRPFGDTYSSSDDGVGYTGHVYDKDIGLNYMQARYYDPVIGRFYSNDPVGALSHLNTANGIHGFNRYAYANNNPFSFIDPDGMQSKPSVKLEEKRERQAAVNTAKAERTVPLSAPSGLGANQMSTAQETHNGLGSQVTQDVMSDEASIAKAFCGCDSIQQSVKQFDAASASEFNDGASLQNGVYQTAVAAIPAAHALKAKDVITGSLAALGASNAVGSLQSAPTVNNGDIVVTTTSMVNGGGRGNVHVSVVKIHQSVN